MKHHLFSTYRYIFRIRDDDSCHLQSRITVNQFTGFVFIIIIALFIIYYFLFNQNPVNPPIFFIKNNSSFKNNITRTYHLANYNHLNSEHLHTKIIDKVQQPPTCFILIRSIDGDIGNRMFLFASAYGLARLHQCELYVASWILKDLRSIFTLNINNTPIHLITNDSAFNQTGIFTRYSSCTLFKDLLKIPLNSNFTKYEMTGFYQAFGYFIRYRDELSYLFQFNQGAIRNNVLLVEQLIKVVWNIPLNLSNYTKENVTHQYLKSLLTQPIAPLIPVTWIGIHIRRGDFLTFFQIDTSVEYLTLAMNYYRRKYINCRFLIASDDKAYAQTHLGNNSDVFITPKTFFSGEDLAALALCEHTILTAGSYGWWGAWLAGGNVVHDMNYPVPSQNCVREHYFPPWFLFPHNNSSPTKSNITHSNK